jgi:hypothetical protein
MAHVHDIRDRAYTSKQFCIEYHSNISIIKERKIIMTTTSKPVLVKFHVVNGLSGEPDRAASLIAAGKAFDEKFGVKFSDDDLARVEVAVNSVLDQYVKSDTKIRVPVLVTLVLSELKAKAAEHERLTLATKHFLSANGSSEREDGKMLRISRGNGDGVRRWSDVPVETVTEKLTNGES